MRLLLLFFTTAIMGMVMEINGLWADCGSRSLDVSFGWRRDNLDWKIARGGCRRAPGRTRSHILFQDIDAYTLGGTARWAGSAYYVRLSAEYGLTEKGRAKEHFRMHNSRLYYPIEVETSDPIKRRSEVFDFDGAVGYPFQFFCSRLALVPLIGFSFHRQHLRVKGDSCDSGCSSNFTFCSSYPFSSGTSSNPFSNGSDPTVAHRLGLCTHHRTSSYRFTWYGFYLGADLLYLLDASWTLFAELECHVFDRCHRKRHSWTGVSVVDEAHKTSWAYGFNALFGTAYYLINNWYAILSVDLKWWKANAKHDDLKWNSVGAKLGVGYMF